MASSFGDASTASWRWMRSFLRYLMAGEIFGLVGESGCGKSATCRSLIRLFAGARPRWKDGEILFGGGTWSCSPNVQLAELRGAEISMIFQDPMTSLNPTMPIGTQIAEVLRRHRACRQQARARRSIFWHVGVTSPADGSKPILTSSAAACVSAS